MREPPNAELNGGEGDDGHCVTAGLSDRFACCLAAPIHDARGRTVATLCFVIPADRPADHRRDLLGRLRGASRSLSAGGA